MARRVLGAGGRRRVDAQDYMAAGQLTCGLPGRGECVLENDDLDDAVQEAAVDADGGELAAQQKVMGRGSRRARPDG